MYTVHYAEAFIVPANVGNVTIEPAVPGSTIMVLRANVRH